MPATTQCGTTCGGGISRCDASGFCVAAPPPDDSNPCTIDACSGATATHTNVPNGTYADDGNLCNGIETCVNGAKVLGTTPLPGGYLVSSDGCTETLCDSVKGLYTAIPVPPAPAPPAYCGASKILPGISPPDPTVTTDPIGSNTWVYTGVNAVQCGTLNTSGNCTSAVNPSVFITGQVGVLRGRVRSGTSALPGVTVSIMNHPEFGATRTQADGQFDMVVNAGGPLLVNYTLTGYLNVQRTALTTWNDYTMLPDVVMIQPDPGTAFDFRSSSNKVASGLAKSDGGPTRTVRVWMRDGTVITDPASSWWAGSGTNSPIPVVHVHATEYTVATNGPQQMPGSLPPTSGYTYAVALQIEEADTAGVAHPAFSQPVSVYLDNFLNVGVGKNVPVGTYERSTGAWVPNPNGTVVNILSVTGGVADVDTDGNGSADAGLDSLERAMLATQYGAGTGHTLPYSVWRIATTHFSDEDFNFAVAPPAGAFGPASGDPDNNAPIERDCKGKGSIIECGNQILAETIPIAGTPYTLRYQSDRVAGFSPKLVIPISGASGAVFPGMNVQVRVEVAGTSYLLGPIPAPVAPSQTVTFLWDHTDGHGRLVQGSAMATVTVEYVYQGVLGFVGNFGGYGSGVSVGGRQNGTVSIYRKYRVPIGVFDAKALQLGGWMLDQHHVLDVVASTLIFGNGDRIYGQTATTQSAASGTTNPTAIATTAGAGGPYDAAYYVLGTGGFIFRIDGAVTPAAHAFAGISNNDAWNGDGGPATSASLKSAHTQALTVGPDGSVFVGQAEGGLVNAGGGVRKITHADPTCSPAGADCIRAVMGGPLVTTAYSTDHVLATSIKASNPVALAVATDGSLYVAEGTLGYIYRIGVDGYLDKIAGSGTAGPPCPYIQNPGVPGDFFYVPDTCPARQASINPAGIALGADGSLYVTDSTHGFVRQITPDGMIHRFAGKPGAPYGLDGDANGNGISGSNAAPAGIDGPALGSTLFHSPIDIAVGPSGTVYVLDRADNCVYGIDSGGSVRRVFGVYAYGGGGPLVLGDPAVDAVLGFGVGNASLLGVLPDGSLLAGGTGMHQIVKSVVPKSLFSSDHSEGYAFGLGGRHNTTSDTLRGVTLATMGYIGNLLTSITDGNAQVTTIDRTLRKITAPGLQATTYTLDANGYLQTVSDPSGAMWHLTHAANGQLQTFVDPDGHSHSFTYTPGQGYLLTDGDPLAGGTPITMKRDEGNRIWSSQLTSQQGRVNVYNLSKTGVGQLPGAPTNRTLRRDNVQWGGGAFIASTEERFVDGQTIAQAPDQTLTTTKYASDPRLGWVASFPNSVQVAYPAGTGTPTTFSRTEARTAAGVNASNPYIFTSESRYVTLNVTQTWTNTFTSATNLWDLASPQGRHVQTTVDAKDRPVKIQLVGGTPALDPINIRYDAKGRIDQVTQGSPVTRTYTTNYDGLNADGTTNNGKPNDNFVYSVVNNTLGLTTTFTSRDAAGRPLNVTLPDGNALGMTYDPNGNVTSVTPPGRTAHGFTPATGVDLLGTYTPPSDALPAYVTTYGYDKDKLLTLLTPPNATVTVGYTYDPFGRLAKVVDSSGDTVLRSYDKVGRPSAVETLGASVGNTARYFAYQGSAIGSGVVGPFLTQIQAVWPPPSGVVRPPSHNVVYSYDLNTRVSGIAIDGAASVPYTYDNDGALASVGSAGTVGTLTVTRDGLTGPTGFVTKTGFVVGAHHVDETYTYNSAGEVVDLSVYVDGSATRTFRQVLGRDAGGRVTTRTDTNGGVTTARVFDYDAAGRLHNVTLNGTLARTYVYDANGNRTKTAPGSTQTIGAQVGFYDAQDRLTSYTGIGAYAYTNNGELSNRAGTGFTYDVRGNLRGAGTTSYVIDGGGRRIASATGAAWKGLLYGRGPRPVAELDALGNVKSTFWYGLRAYTPDFMVQAGVTYRILSDYLGSPRLVVRMSDGAVVAQLDFDEWGVETDSVNPGFQPFGFTGGLYDAGTGLLKLGARDYEASSGRWVSKDRSRFGGGLNFYQYAKNDPVNYVDRRGKHASPAFFGGSVATGELGLGLAGGSLVVLAGEVFVASAAVGALIAEIANAGDVPTVYSNAASDPPEDKAEDDQSEEGEEDEEAGVCRVNKGNRGRFKSGDDALEQEDGVRENQSRERAAGRPDKIYSIEKSKQRLKNSLDQMRGTGNRGRGGQDDFE